MGNKKYLSRSLDFHVPIKILKNTSSMLNLANIVFFYVIFRSVSDLLKIIQIINCSERGAKDMHIVGHNFYMLSI